MNIESRAIVEPIYINASADFGRWYSHNWRALDQYYKDLGGDRYAPDTGLTEYLGFCQSQFDRQNISELDVKLANEAEDQTARNLSMLRSA